MLSLPLPLPLAHEKWFVDDPGAFGADWGFASGAASLTLIALLVLNPVVQASVAMWSADVRISRAVVVTLTAAVAVAAVWKLFHGTPHARLLFLGGLVGGLSLLALR